MTPSTATGSFLGSLSTSSSTRVLSYTVNYSGLTPMGISLDPVSTSTSATTGTTTTGTTNYSNSILLTGAFPSTTTSPGSGTSTSPGSGTSTSPGSGTSTSPGSGTITSPLSGTLSVAQTRADSLSRSLYRLNIRSATYPNGEIGGTVQVR